MKTRMLLLASAMCLMNISNIFARTSITISTKDLKLMTGNWYGSLTYLDYSSGKPYTMLANLAVNKIRKKKLVFFNSYPNEPKANSADTITITGNGTMIDEQVIKSVRKLNNRNKEIVAEYLSVDGNDNKSAIIRYTYTVGKNTFSKKKEVQFTGQTEWIKRHEFSYTRNKTAG